MLSCTGFQFGHLSSWHYVFTSPRNRDRIQDGIAAFDTVGGGGLRCQPIPVGVHSAAVHLIQTVEMAARLWRHSILMRKL